MSLIGGTKGNGFSGLLFGKMGRRRWLLRRLWPLCALILSLLTFASPAFAALPPTATYGTCQYGNIDLNSNIVWNHSNSTAPFAPTYNGTAFPSGTNLTVGSGLSTVLVGQSLNVDNADSLGVDSAYDNNDFLNFQFTTMANPVSPLILRHINFGLLT